MGVLDDAIREHLELKRQHGARDTEIKELEDEAFGPPSRPGDPDFPARETDEGPAVAGDGSSAVSDAPTMEEQPVAEHELVAAPELDEQPPTQLMDAGADAAAEQSAPVAEPDVAEADESESAAGLFDQAEQDDPAELGDLGVEDLDLKLDENEDVVPPAAEEPPAVEQPASEKPPAEEVGAEPVSTIGLPTEEHPFPGEELVEEEGESEELPLELDEESEELPLEPENGTDEEDVLEETPEFLREKPEDEELWFEQGEPKDFDFEDEDEKK